MAQKILSGKWRAFPLFLCKNSFTRPTSSLVRLAVFNIWREGVGGSRFLDLFSGTGAMAFEALSLGAKAVTMVESQKEALVVLRKNVEKFRGCVEEQEIDLFARHVESFFPAAKKEPYDFVYADPPYDWSPEKGSRGSFEGRYLVWLLENLEGCTKVQTRVMVEQAEQNREVVPSRVGPFQHLETRTYGSTKIHHFERYQT